MDQAPGERRSSSGRARRKPAVLDSVTSGPARCARTESAQSLVDRMVVDGEAPRGRADADAAVMCRSNLCRDEDHLRAYPRSRHVMVIVTSAGAWITLRIPAAHSRALACRICVFRCPAPVHVSNPWFASASVLLGLGISRRSCSQSSSPACLFRLDTSACAAIPIVATVPAASTALIAHAAVCVSIGLLCPLVRLGVRLVSFGVGRVHPRVCGAL